MSCRVSAHVFVAVLILFLLAVPAAAQVDRASLTGTVTDASGAVVVKAMVRVTHEGSGLQREGEVGTGGAYMIPQLPIGIYTIKIEAAGFRGVQFDKVELLVGQTRTLDAKLDIATSSTAIRCATRWRLWTALRRSWARWFRPRKFPNCPSTGGIGRA